MNVYVCVVFCLFRSLSVSLSFMIRFDYINGSNNRITLSDVIQVSVLLKTSKDGGRHWWWWWCVWTELPILCPRNMSHSLTLALKGNLAFWFDYRSLSNQIMSLSSLSISSFGLFFVSLSLSLSISLSLPLSLSVLTKRCHHSFHSSFHLAPSPIASTI